jgi:hypothetical protein
MPCILKNFIVSQQTPEASSKCTHLCCVLMYLYAYAARAFPFISYMTRHTCLNTLKENKARKLKEICHTDLKVRSSKCQHTDSELQDLSDDNYRSDDNCRSLPRCSHLSLERVLPRKTGAALPSPPPTPSAASLILSSSHITHSLYN